MTIVWGHNNYRLTKVQPHEVGLFDESYKNITFELRQKYGHLFWIPFFPIGRIWAVTKGDGKLYVCPAELEPALEQVRKRKPWTAIWAWSGFLAIFLGIILFNISERVSHARYEAYAESSYIENAALLETQIDTAKPGELLFFKEDEAGYFTTKQMPLKVMRVTTDKILVGFWPLDKTYESESINGVSYPLPALENSKLQDSFWVDKSQLKAAIVKKRDDEMKFTGVVLKQFSTNPLQLNEVKPVPLPKLMESRTTEARTMQYTEIENQGLYVHADSLVSLSRDVKWQLSKARDLGKNEQIAVKANGFGEALLYCSDKEHHKYIFTISNRDNWLIELKS